MHETAAARTIKLTINSHLEDVFLIGLATQAFCSYAPFNEVEAYQVQLAVVEAITNTIKHAYGNQPDQEIELSVSLSLDRMTFQVLDRGNPLLDLHKRELEFDPRNRQSLPESGMGLFIIQKVMDEITYHSDQKGNTFTMVKFFKHRSPS